MKSVRNMNLRRNKTMRRNVSNSKSNKFYGGDDGSDYGSAHSEISSGNLRAARDRLAVGNQIRKRITKIIEQIDEIELELEAKSGEVQKKTPK